MATWTTIPNTSIETDKPIRAVDGRALRDNVTALAEGASGAPEIRSAALQDYPWGGEDIRDGSLGAEKFQSGSAEESWVVARYSGANLNQVGSMRFAFYKSTTTIAPGSTSSGSNFGTRSINSTSFLVSSTQSDTALSALPGTWRYMGQNPINASGIDGSDTVPSGMFLRIA